MLASPSLRINQEPLHKEIESAIRNAILKGDLRPGERLIEGELAERLGVSRAPLREALSQLVAQGLLVNVPRRGTTVIELTANDIREIFSLRLVLEVLAVEIITPTFKTENLGQFEELIGQMRSISMHDVPAMVDLEMRFHETLTLISGHSRLHDAWARMGGQLRAFFAAADTKYEDVEFIERHKILLDAIASKDTERAVATLREHVANGADRVLGAMQSADHADNS